MKHLRTWVDTLSPVVWILRKRRLLYLCLNQELALPKFYQSLRKILTINFQEGKKSTTFWQRLDWRCSEIKLPYKSYWKYFRKMTFITLIRPLSAGQTLIYSLAITSPSNYVRTLEMFLLWIVHTKQIFLPCRCWMLWVLHPHIILLTLGLFLCVRK